MTLMPATENGPSDLSVSEAAANLGVHPDTLVRWAKDGKVPCWITPGGHRRFAVADLDALKAAS